MTFSALSNCDDVIQGHNLDGKRILVTGASAGLGLETTRCLATAGAKVIMAARNADKLTAAQQQILAKVPDATLHSLLLDLSDLNSVRKAAQQVLADGKPIDVLINNAGVMACPFGKTTQGFEMQFGSNHLGHFLFTVLLSPLLLKAEKARVVCLSSAAHKFAAVNLDDPNYTQRPYNKWQAYGEAKSANALFALALNARLAKHGVEAFSVHPGMIATELGRHLDADDLKMLMGKPKDKNTEKPKDKPDNTNSSADKTKSSPFKTIPQGAATTVWAATASELAGKGGGYLEDCQLAQASSSMSKGYAAHIADMDTAEKLWRLSEDLVAERFSFQRISEQP